jgi:dTMP kinase
MNQKENIELTKGLLIVFEGIDGTGKSTQLSLLADALQNKGYPVITTREPTNGTYGKKIRSLYDKRNEVTTEEELELFLQDRREHVENLLAPCLAEKKIILCDRYYLSTIAYQGAAGFDTTEIERKNNFAPEPDLALLFHMSSKVSMERITEIRGDALNDFEQEETLRKAAQIFDGLSFPYIRRIDAACSIESVHHSVISLVEDHLQAFRINL